jgi:hypothetical protein
VCAFLLCETSLWHLGGSDKISMAIQLVKVAIKTSFEPVNVLADFLFMCNTLMPEIKKFKKDIAKNINVNIYLSE